MFNSSVSEPLDDGGCRNGKIGPKMGGKLVNDDFIRESRANPPTHHEAHKRKPDTVIF
jgi:hypothetical protein